MTAKERTVWEQAVLVLRRNTVTNSAAIEKARKAERVLAGARERAASQRRIVA